MTHRDRDRLRQTIAFLLALSAAMVATGQVLAGQHYKLCRDANGNPVFTDGSCPPDTAVEGEGHVANGQTYDGRESIDTGMLNHYEGRHDTGRQWGWQTAPAQPDSTGF